MTDRPIARALLSVSDKTGLPDLARALAGRGVELVSTGGTGRALAAAGIAAQDVADLTGFPEMMDGRVKTLHPRVHGGLLALRDDPGHRLAMADHGIAPIDLLVVNLYPFAATVAAGAPRETVIETIDVGGPAMIRAAAKNFGFVTTLTDPADYPALLAALHEGDGATAAAFRERLAGKAFAHTAAYDAAIAAWFAGEAGDAFPETAAIAGVLAETLRYGENPHQRAAFYRGGAPRPGVATALQVQGKALSYNNLADTDAAYELAGEFDPAEGSACVIVKHANPCGAAQAGTLAEAYRAALACDPTSAFGGVVAFNRVLDGETARAVAAIFTEVIIAPDAEPQARAVLAGKRNLRLLLAGALPDPRAPGMTVRSLAGGLLMQDRDALTPRELRLRSVGKRPPTEAEERDLAFAWRVAKHVKSNAIVFAKDGATVGIGAGQMSRVDSVRIAAAKAAETARAAGLAEPRTVGSVVASDAFFPFADGLLLAAQAGATAVIQPGGSVRDADIIAAADANGLAMLFTGVRHFRH